CDHVLARRLARLDLDAVQHPVVLENPLLEADDVLARLGIGVNLEPALHAEQAAYAADRYSPGAEIGVRHHFPPGKGCLTPISRSPGRRQAASGFAADFRYCLIS